MVLHTCSKCGFKTQKKSTYVSHLNRIDCVKSMLRKQKKQLKCEYCGELRCSKYSLEKHALVCKVKKNKEYGSKNNANKIVIDKLNIVEFAKDGIDDLTKKEMREIMNTDNHITKLIKLVNFDEDKPEHHNVLFTNVNSSYGKVYRDGKWETEHIIIIINRMIDTKVNDLKLILDKFHDKLDDVVKKNVEKTIDDLTDNNKIERIDRENVKKNIKSLRSHIKPLLVNNRQMVKETKKNN